MAILDIRGTHGSGKSWLVHRLIKESKPEPEYIYEDGSNKGVFLENRKTAVVGLYDRVCGGCDGIKTAEEVCERVKLFSTNYTNVVLEGILVAHTFKRYAALATDLKKKNYKFLFLNTPLEVCISRVEKRRAARGKTGDFDPRNVVKDWNCIWGRRRLQFKEAGFTVVELDWQNPYPQLLKELD